MAKSHKQSKLQQDPMYLDPKSPETWGEEASTTSAETVEELPVRVAVLVRDKQFVGLRGPRRVLNAIQEDYLHQVDLDGLYEDACRCPRGDDKGH